MFYLKIYEKEITLLKIHIEDKNIKKLIYIHIIG